MRGIIEHLRADRGFGFIRPDGADTELFFHASETNGSFFELEKGDVVEFETQQSRSKPGKQEAVHVKAIH